MTDLSESPFQGMANWTGGANAQGDLGSLRREIDAIKARLVQHFHVDNWNSRLDFPHPNQRVSTLYFAGGYGRLDQSGIQFYQDNVAPPPTITVVSDTFKEDPLSSYPNFVIAPNVYVGSAPSRLELGINLGASNLWGLDIAAGGVTDAFFIRAGASYISWSDTAARWTVAGGVLRIPFTTGDSTFDGEIYYRTDTNVFRGIKNGVARTFLMDDYVPPAATSLDLPYVSVAVSTLATSTQCFIDVDASGGARTITLPSAATLTSGFTYIVRKLDATNNSVIVDPNSTQTIDGVQTYTLTKQYETLTIVSNGANWDIWGAYNNQLYVATTATSVTVGPRDTFLGMSTASGNVTANLPTAVGIAGREITLKKTTSDTNTLTVDPNSTQAIDGVTTWVLTSPGEITIVSDGANWLIKAYSSDGFRATTTTATTTAADRTVSANASGGAYTITLVTAVGNAGLTQTFKKIGTDYNVVTIDGNSAETIDGVLTLGLSSPNQYFTLTSDGAGWLITGAGL